MKIPNYVSVSLFWIILVLPFFVSAQENSSAEWIRVQSDNGEFSVEIPVEYDFYGDNDGFPISKFTKIIELKEMRMLNAFREKTLVSFETYETNHAKEAADIFLERDKKEGKKSEITFNGLKVKQILINKDGLYAVRRFLISKTHLYILTAASRNGETSALKRYLDSALLKTSNAKSATSETFDNKLKIVSFSSLKISQLEVDQNPDSPQKTDNQTTIPVENKITPLSIIIKPLAFYTEAARKSGETGVVKLRLTFSTKGSITKVKFLSALQSGLLRQCIFAAIRIKFIPAERNGEPIFVTKQVEYSFSIY